MTGQNRGQRATWLRVAVVVGVAIAAHAVGASSAQAAPIPAPATSDVVLAGLTSQHYPVFFKVAANGKMVLTGALAISMNCTSGGVVVVTDGVGRVPIHAGGRLHTGYTSPTILTNGTSDQGTDAVTARINAKHSILTGTWRLAVNYGFSDGTSDHCDSGPVTFSATA